MLDKSAQNEPSRQPPGVRREQLIHAMISAIAEHGLSHVTLSKVGAEIGLTAGMINFHFDGKQALLTATLQFIADEFADACEAAMAEAGDDPAAGLMALVSASFDPQICEPGRVSVWYAFWGESRARQDYLAICGHSDKAFDLAVSGLLEQLAQQTNSTIDIKAASLGLTGMVDAFWQELLVDPDAFDHTAAIATCRAYLGNLFPSFAETVTTPRPSIAPADGLPRTLPAWTYGSEEFFRHEIEQVHKPAWQLVCHVSDVPKTGDYFTFSGLGERAFVIRGEDGALRAFHNVCPHRAHAVVGGTSGSCEHRLRCPYHAWTFDFTGELVAIASRKTFPPFDDGQFGLRPLELEVFMGLVFIRFIAGGPTVAERYAPHEPELVHYRFEDMEPIAPFHEEEIDADWKNVWDNYLEDYHFPTGHPGLYGLMTPDYDREPDDDTRTVRLSHAMRDKPKGGWSVERYAGVLPAQTHLPENLRRRWSYFFLYPSVSLDVYPEKMDFFQLVPVAPSKSRLRCGTYGLPGAGREIKAARFLSGRINWQVHREDCNLIASVQGGLATSAYDTGVLGAKEVAPQAFQRWLREDLPEAGGSVLPQGLPKAHAF